MRILSNDYEVNIPGELQPLVGGATRFARDFATFLKDEGHEWVGIMRGGTAPEPQILLRADAPQHRLYDVRMRSIGAKKLAQYDSLATVAAAYEPEQAVLAAFIRDQAPDVVFLNGLVPFFWLLARAARDAGVPVVLQHAGIFAQELAAYASLHDPTYAARAREMECATSEAAAGNIFLNEHSHRMFAHWYPDAVLSGVQYIPLPHAGWAFAPAPKPRTHTARRIGVVARWDRIKNHEAVCRLAARIRHTHPDWEVCAVTSIPDTSARAAFKAAYREHITVLPPMDREALRAFYASLDMLLLPSHFETAGGVVAEALACGTPALVSPHVGWVDAYRACDMHEWIVDFSDTRAALQIIETQLARTTWPELACLRTTIMRDHDPKTVYTRYLDSFRVVSEKDA